MIDLAPLFGLKLRTPRLELRLGTPDDVSALGELAVRGIHPPDEMPFAVAWSDRILEPSFAAEFAAYHAAGRSSWRPESWRLDLLTWEGSELVGTQGLLAEHFSTDRVVSTGSWLGQDFQGRGIGTEMRTAVLELAFRGLGARAAKSGWLEGNLASARVARKLGYTQTGLSEISPRGVAVPHHDMRLESTDWAPAVPVEIVGLDPALALFGAG